MANPGYIDADGVLTDGEAYIPIATTVLTADTATVTFTNPADGSSTDWSQFLDLVLISVARSTSTYEYDYDYLRMSLNNSTASGVTPNFRLYLGGAAVYQDAGPNSSYWTIGTIPATGDGGSPATEFSAGVTTIHNINSGQYKSGTSLSGSSMSASGPFSNITSVSFASDAPLTEIDLTVADGSLADHSSFSLFGVLPRMGAVA